MNTETPLQDGSSQTELNCSEVSTQTRCEVRDTAAQTEIAAVRKVLVVQEPNATTAAQADAETGESSQVRKNPARFILDSSDDDSEAEDSDAEDRQSRLDALCAKDSYEKQKK